MLRLGEYLCEQRLLSEEQLEEALSHQAVYGARLGTNLVELEMIGIERLAECLSDFHKVPLPPRPWLIRPSKEAIQRVTRPLVERLRFIPLRLDGNLLHAAVLSPRDPPVLDDLRFATGCRIEPYVLPEIWMHDWLLTLFSVPRGIRHVETGVASEDDLFEAEPEHSQPDRDSEPSSEPQPAARRRAPRPAQTSRTTPGLPVAPFLARMAAARARRAADEAAEGPVEAAADSDPANVEPSGAGSSVRPPPITVQSLAELAKSGRTLGGYPAVRPKRTSLWDQQLPESAPPTSLQDALAQAGEAAERAHDAVRAASSAPPPRPAAPATMPPPPLSMPAREPPVAEAPPLAARALPTIADLEAGILVAADREELVELALLAVNRFARHASLFIAQKGVLQGARSVEDGFTRPLDGLLVPLDSPCVLTEIGTEAKPARVAPGAHVLDAQLLRMLGDEGAQEVGLFPVRIRKRMVNLLYASNGAEPLGPVAFAALTALAQLLGKSYERLIIARKQS